jgi:uncharacterized protein (DUF2141 family)
VKTLLLLLALLKIPEAAYAANLAIDIVGLKNDHGLIHYIVFRDQKGFPTDESKAVKKGSLNAGHAKNGIILTDLETGKYALSVIHDSNSNHKLDTFLGIPTEQFGFSNNPRIYFGPPDFNESSFELSKDSEISILLKGI